VLVVSEFPVGFVTSVLRLLDLEPKVNFLVVFGVVVSTVHIVFSCGLTLVAIPITLAGLRHRVVLWTCEEVFQAVVPVELVLDRVLF